MSIKLISESHHDKEDDNKDFYSPAKLSTIGLKHSYQRSALQESTAMASEHRYTERLQVTV